MQNLTLSKQLAEENRSSGSNGADGPQAGPIRTSEDTEGQVVIRRAPTVNNPANPHCSFCGNFPEGDRSLTAGAAAWICNHCATLAEDANRQLRRHPKPRQQDHHCSFCGKRQDAVDNLVAGPGVFICNHCSANAASASQQ